MNHFSVTKKLNSDDLNKVMFSMSPDVADRFIEIFKEHFTVQLLQGEQITLPDGQIELRFELNDEDASLLKKAFLQAYVIHSGHDTSN